MHFQICSTLSIMPTLIIVFIVVSFQFQVTHSSYIFRLSDSCHPPCQREKTCIKQIRNCSLSKCPAIIYCVQPRHFPRRYRASIQSLLTTPSPRAGCPNRLLNSPCITQCQQDSSCRAGHLCCFNGCGHVCSPDLRLPYRPKPGFCPRPSWNTNPTCESNCQNDFECRGHKKCCQTLCGNKCTHPCFYRLTDNGRWRLPPGCSGPAR